MGELAPIRKLAGNDAVKSFDCGQVDLNTWLSTYAYPNQRSGMATVFVATPQEGDQVVGYYALATGGVEHSDAPARVVKGIPRHPVPVILLTRLAVDTSMQGRGLGAALLRDALIRVSAAADEIGVRALLIHAKDDGARSFYMSQAEFEPSPTDSMHLFLLIKDLRKALSA
jgi:GNAT superfamily N-acetyltransferase